MPTADRRPPSGSRPSRSQRRQQRLAAAAAEQLALRDRLLGHLVMQHQAAYNGPPLIWHGPPPTSSGSVLAARSSRPAAARRHPMTSWSGLPSPA
jgi:hypothetical protein